MAPTATAPPDLLDAERRAEKVAPERDLGPHPAESRPPEAIAAAAAASPVETAAALGSADLGGRIRIFSGLQRSAGNAAIQRLVARPAGRGPASGSAMGASWEAGPSDDVGPGPGSIDDAASGASGSAIVPGLGGAAGASPPDEPRPTDPGRAQPTGRPVPASVAVAQRLPIPSVQRDTTPGPGGGSDEPDGPEIPYDGFEDPIFQLDDMGQVFYMVSLLTPDEAARKQNLPEELVKPTAGIIMTTNKIIGTDAAGTPVTIRDHTGPVPLEERRAFIVQVKTGRAWMLLTRLGAIERAVSGASMPPIEGEEFTVKDSILVVYLPGVTVKPEQVAEIERRIQAGVRARKRAAGPEPWARKQVGAAEKRLKERRAAPKGGSGTEGEGPGAGEKGTGPGGGGDQEPPVAKTGSGEGASDTERILAQVPPTPGQGADSIKATVNANGDSVAVVTADGATTTIALRPGEKTDALLARADAAGDKLREDRNAASSVRIAHGATETKIAPPKAGTGGGTVVDPALARDQAATANGATPGERDAFPTGDANTPPYPAEIKTFGMQPPRAPLTVSGATNSFAMELDRGPDVLNYFQPIQYYWELIDVSRMTALDRANAAASRFRRGEKVGLLSGDLQDIVRAHENIAEDVRNESWETIATQYTYIGIDAAVRSIGSVISAFFALITRPLNEQSIGFDKEGDYILRCVATPQVDREYLRDRGIPPDRWVIRQSSIAVLPIRVQNISTRAIEANKTEDNELAVKQAELAAAKARGAGADEIAAIQKEIDELTKRRGMSAPQRIAATIADVERMMTLLAELESNDFVNLPLKLRKEAVLELDVGIRMSGQSRADFRAQNQKSLEALKAQLAKATEWEGAFTKDAQGLARSYRPRVAFASEVTGQTIQMVMMLGEEKDSVDGDRHWILADVTSESTRQRYHGRSKSAGLAGQFEAIRNAFVDFRENGEYGRGTIAIALPEDLAKFLGAPVPLETAMRAAPGATERAMGRLKSLGKAALLAGLVVGGPAGLAIGAIGGVAGAVVAVHSMIKRSEGDRLKFDFETFMDIVNIIGGVVGLASVGTAIAGSIARGGAALAKVGATTEELGKAAGSFRWVQRIEMTDRAIHIFGLVQNAGQVIIIPLTLARQLSAIDADKDASPGQKRARRMLAIAEAMQSGIITVVTTAQMLKAGTPQVTSDAVVWDRLAAATAEAPATVPHEGVTPTVPAKDAPTPSPDARPTGRDETTAGPKVAKVEPPPLDQNATSGAGTSRTDVPGPDHPAPTEGGPLPRPAETTAPGAPRPTVAPPRGLSANQVVAAARRIISGNRAEPPPSGRIRYVSEAEFARVAGPAEGAVGILEPASGVLVLSLERAQAAGVVPRLRALVEARAHVQAARHLGEPLVRALMDRIIPDVLAGDPGGRPRGAGDAIVDRLQAEVGIGPLLETLFHGDIGALQTPLRERLGNARADAVLVAARRGATDTMAMLLQRPQPSFVDRYGTGTAAAVADLVTADLGGTPREGGRVELARAIGDVVGRDVLQEAFATGTTTRLDAALETALGTTGAAEARRALLEGRTADALTTLRGAREPAGGRVGPADRGTTAEGPTGAPREPAPTGGRPTVEGGAPARETGPGPGEGGPAGRPATGEPAPPAAPAEVVPTRATDAAQEFVGALGRDQATVTAGARRLIETMANFRLLRRLVEGGAIGSAAQREAVLEVIQSFRRGVTDDVLAGVKAAIEKRFPGVEVHLQDLGTPGFGSDRDVTMRVEPRAGVEPVPSVNDLVAASTEAVRDAYQALRDRGLDPDAALDTNFYTELHEGRVEPANATERAAISGEQSIVSLTEMRMGMSEARWRAHREAQLRAIDRSGAPDNVIRDMRTSMERQFTAAEERAARLSRGDAALQGARQRLLDALGRTPKPTAQELRSLMADVKLLEPDAYGTRAAVEGVVYGQQGMTRATSKEGRATAGEHLGTVGRGEGTLPEQIGHRAQQAEAALAHFWSHFPEGTPRPGDVRSMAKQLGRIAHAFKEAGLSFKSRLVDETGAVVGAKTETNADAATMRELRGWAEDTGQHFASDEALLRAYANEASRMATDLSTRLRTSQETARIVHPEGDGGAAAPPRPPAQGGTGGQTGGGAGETAPRPAGTAEAPTPVPSGDEPTAGPAGRPTTAPAAPEVAPAGLGGGSRPLGLLEAYQLSLTPRRGSSHVVDWLTYVSHWTRDTGGFGNPPSHGYQMPDGRTVLFMEGGRFIENDIATTPPAEYPVPRTQAEWAVAQRAQKGISDPMAARRAAVAAIEALRADTTGVANDPQANPSGPGEGPSLATDAGGDPLRRRGSEPVEIQLPSSTVITGGRRPFTRDESLGVARNARRDRPYDEVGILQNLDSGEFAVIQGNNVRSSGDAANAALRELHADAPGRWVFVDHSHPIDPRSGVTPARSRLPSGENGDFRYLARRAEAWHQPLEATLTYTTERGPQELRYGVDPAGPTFWVEGPGVPRREFPSLEGYGDWYASQFGMRPDGFNQPAPGTRTGPGPTNTSEGGGAKGGTGGSAPAGFTDIHAAADQALRKTFNRAAPAADRFQVGASEFHYAETWRQQESTRDPSELPPGPGYTLQDRIYLSPHAGIPTATHESLHLLSPKAWRDAVPTFLNEGITELFTERAVGRSEGSSYDRNVEFARRLEGIVGRELLERAYFDGDVAALKAALEPALGGASRVDDLFGLLRLLGDTGADIDLVRAAHSMLGGPPPVEPAGGEDRRSRSERPTIPPPLATPGAGGRRGGSR